MANPVLTGQLLAQDTFTQADQATWNPSSDGRTWTQVTGTETLSIVSNKGQSTGVTGESIDLLGTDTVTDAEALVKVSFSLSNDVPALILRYQSSGNYYKLNMNTGLLSIDRGASTLVSTSFPVSASTDYWMRFRVIGPNLYGKMWAASNVEPPNWMLQTSDWAVQGKGRYGLRTFGRSTTDVYLFDSYTVTDGVLVLPRPRYVPRAFLSTIVPDSVTQPLAYVDRPMGGTIIYEDRTFIPRALGGVYIPDTVLWVPRAFGGTLSLPLATVTTYTFTEALTANDSASAFVQVALPIDGLSASDALLATDTDTSLDSLSTSDIGGFFGWPVDSLTATDSLLVVDADIPLDGLSVSDSLLGADGSLYTEANAAGDSLSSGGTGTFTDGLPTSDNLLESETFIPLDANTTGDTLLKVDGYLPLDALSALDNLLGTDPYLPSDGLVGATTPLEWDIYLPTDDGLSASDSSSMTQGSPGGGPVNNTYNFTDALVANDTLLASLVDVPLDGLSVADALVCSAGASLIDALSASDMGGLARSFVDALSISDTLVQSDVYLPAEVQSVLESIVAGDSTLWVDALTASDTFTALVVSSQPLQYINVTWVTRDMTATWTTRDGKATWVTRDDKAGWSTRDEQASWNTRDELATWKTRR